MRLTLRTLLAYMDDILDPADHEALGKKIESSDFASELIHRSRDTVRRLRLSAPDVLESHTDDTSKGGFDANMVAEYLDNTMAPEKVADFERICLESDMHLAEVASCHHVLTMVLGEPVEVNEAVRKRIYALPDGLASGKQLRIEPAHHDSRQQAAEVVEAQPSDTQQNKTSPIHQAAEAEIPDYLQAAARSKRRSRKWLVAAVLILGVAGYMAYWESVDQDLPSDLVGAAAEILVGGPVISEPVISEPVESPSAADSVASTEEEVDPNSQAAPFVPSSPAPEIPSANPDNVTEETRTDVQEGLPVIDVPEGEMLTPSPQEGDPTSENATEPLGTLKIPEPDALPTNPDLTESEQVLDPQIRATDRAEGDGETANIASTSDGVRDAIETEQPAETTTEPAEKKPVRIGNYLGNDDVMLRFDTEQNAWVRVLPRSELHTGERLLALPKFRSPVVLAGLNVSLSGGTQISLPIDATSLGEGYQEGPLRNEKTDIAMEIVFGRVLFNAGLSGNGLVLIIDDQIRRLRLGDSASLALEVRRKYVPGNHAGEVSAPIVATWYLTSGSLQKIGENEEQTIEAPAMWQMADHVDKSPKSIEELPPWIDREPVTASERLALTVLDDELPPGEPVEIRLLELNDPQQRGRRQEVRSLAAQCSVYVGEFEPFVKALSDGQQKAAWKAHIDTLRQAMVLSPDAANSIYDAFVTLRGETAADDLMQMVRGYNAQSIGTTPEEVRNGAMSQLIRWLDSDSLDYRVLAYHNLHEITGKSIGGYRPTYNSSQRQRALRIWQKRLESGELLP